MKTGATIDLKCAAAMRSLDALLDGELSETVAGTVRNHLSACPTCSEELQLRRSMRHRLRAAVASEQPSPYLGTRVLAQVRAQSQRPRWLQRSGAVSAIAAAVLVTFGAVIAYQLGHLRFTVESQNAYISSLVRRVGYVMGAGLSDHVHCSVFREFQKDPPSLDTLHQQIGSEYKQLVDVVSSKMPDGFRIFIAHECGYMGRRFIHIALRNESKLISVVLAKKKPGESFQASNLLPVISQGGLDVYGASVQRFEIAGFETAGHLAYVVSDVSQKQTRELMLALAPGIRDVLATVKS